MTYQKIGEGAAEHNAPAIKLSLTDIVDGYDRKLAGIPDAIAAYSSAIGAVKTAACIGGAFGGTVTSESGIHESAMKSALLSSAWRHVYNGLQIEAVASAKDRKKLKLFLTDPEPFTLLNIRDTFGDYLIDPRYHILKGLAECFTDLDPAYKSHAKVKIGVKGLPKRIIVSSCGEYSGWGRDKVQDVLNALSAYNNRPRIEYAEFQELMATAKKGERPEYHGVELVRYQNDNCHMIFDKQTLLDVNRALAEFYGEVLADSPEAEQEHAKQTGTAVSKDLAFYPTPQGVIDRLLSDTHIKPDMRVLEPSCGTGAILKAIIKQQRRVRIVGIEVHGGRATEARETGCKVMIGNFLDIPPAPVFDYVIMNPPFCGKHYQKHVNHAKKFLKPGGTLKAILPATAHYDHDFCGDPKKSWNNCWSDLPVGSFKESGTNIPTGIYTWTRGEV